MTQQNLFGQQDLFGHPMTPRTPPATYPTRRVAVHQERMARDEAIDQVEENNPDPVERAISNALGRLPQLPMTVCSEDIFPDLGQYGFTDNRAVGAVMRALVKQGVVKATPQFRASARKGNHSGPRRVYVNQLAQPKQGQP